MFNEKNIPIQQIRSDELDRRGIHLDMKRLDLIHPVVSGNKWFKLKYNLKKAVDEGFDTVLSFGGAYSNHIHALAGAAREFGLKSIGIIRGEESLPLNPTLSFAKECGMAIEYIDRRDYREKNKPEFVSKLRKKYGDVFIIPEGGSNGLAVKGCTEILDDKNRLYDYVLTPVGTGGTMAGLIASHVPSKILGVQVLKGDFLQGEIENLLSEAGVSNKSKYELIDGYHFGGYAKFDDELVDFINDFKKETGIPLDPIYTGKLVYAFCDLMRKSYFKKGGSVLLIHTGGIQGIAGFNERYGGLIKG